MDRRRAGETPAVPRDARGPEKPTRVMAGQRARFARPFFVKTLAASGELSPAISVGGGSASPTGMAATRAAMTWLPLGPLAGGAPAVLGARHGRDVRESRACKYQEKYRSEVLDRPSAGASNERNRGTRHACYLARSRRLRVALHNVKKPDRLMGGTQSRPVQHTWNIKRTQEPRLAGRQKSTPGVGLEHFA